MSGKAVALTVGFGIIGLLATFVIIELFSGPIPVFSGKGGMDPAYKPQAAPPPDFGAQGSKIAQTAAEATNVFTSIAQDAPQVASDAASVVESAKEIAGLFKKQPTNQS